MRLCREKGFSFCNSVSQSKNRHYVCNIVAQARSAEFTYTEIVMHAHSHSHQNTDRSSRLSALLSIACAIHCALTPMLISILPLIGMQFLASHLLEGVLLAFGVGFGAYGVLRGYFYQHRDIRPVLALGAGVTLITIGFFFAPESVEPFLVSTGALGIAAAQILNMRAARKCNHAH
jgi:MerC mercury resistance protein